MADKFEVKQLVASKVGGDIIVPNLGVFKRVDDIDYDSLPDQFVIKCTHDSSGVFVCKDKASFN